MTGIARTCPSQPFSSATIWTKIKSGWWQWCRAPGLGTFSQIWAHMASSKVARA